MGSSITLLFFAIENGVDYVTKVALYNIHGLFAALAFSIGYYISTFYKGKFEIFLSLLISFISYLIIALLLAYIPPHIILTPLIVISLMLIASIYFAKKENFAIDKSIKSSLSDIFFRSLLTISIFLIVYFTYGTWGITLGTITALVCSVLYVWIQGKILKALNLIK